MKSISILSAILATVSIASTSVVAAPISDSWTDSDVFLRALQDADTVQMQKVNWEVTHGQDDEDDDDLSSVISDDDLFGFHEDAANDHDDEDEIDKRGVSKALLKTAKSATKAAGLGNKSKSRAKPASSSRKPTSSSRKTTSKSRQSQHSSSRGSRGSIRQPTVKSVTAARSSRNGKSGMSSTRKAHTQPVGHGRTSSLRPNRNVQSATHRFSSANKMRAASSKGRNSQKPSMNRQSALGSAYQRKATAAKTPASNARHRAGCKRSGDHCVIQMHDLAVNNGVVPPTPSSSNPSSSNHRNSKGKARASEAEIHAQLMSESGSSHPHSDASQKQQSKSKWWGSKKEANILPFHGHDLYQHLPHIPAKPDVLDIKSEENHHKLAKAHNEAVKLHLDHAIFLQKERELHHKNLDQEKKDRVDRNTAVRQWCVIGLSCVTGVGYGAYKLHQNLHGRSLNPTTSSGEWEKRAFTDVYYIADR